MTGRFLPAGLLLFAGCATVPAVFPVDYVFADAPDAGGVRLSYTNRTKKTLCLGPSEWPTPGGKMNHASQSVRLVVGDRRYPIEDFNTGYCVGGCPTYVGPWESVSGFIAYTAFGLPEALRLEPKRLEFSPTAYTCRKPARP